MKKTFKNALLYILFSSFLVCPVYAELYKWVDENGITHFSNTAPPKSSDQIEIGSEVHSVESQKTNVSNNVPSANEVNPAKVEFYKGYMEKWVKLLSQYQNELEEIKRETNIDQQQHEQKLAVKNEQIRKAKIKSVLYRKFYEKAMSGK